MRIAMIAITTNNSISVKPRSRRMGCLPRYVLTGITTPLPGSGRGSAGVQSRPVGVEHDVEQIGLAGGGGVAGAEPDVEHPPVGADRVVGQVRLQAVSSRRQEQ